MEKSPKHVETAGVVQQGNTSTLGTCAVWGAGKKNGGSPYGWRSASSDKVVPTCDISEEPTAAGHTQQESSIARSPDEQACRNACLNGEESQRT